MRVRNATALALAETAVASHSGISVDTAVDRLEVAYVRWRISGQGLPLSVPQLFCGLRDLRIDSQDNLMR